METIKAFLASQAFDRATHRAGAYLLLFSNLLFPHGLHRWWMQLPGWWWFPSAFFIASVGAWKYLSSHAAAWLLLTLPYPLVFTFDFWVLALSPVPVKSGK
ncbi:hypothetical protein ACQKFX_21365 [Cupriavidus metallidurans]|uniref:hypothetical protein n=1 Tax=Cupriavidus metallidurans TaxID=119219 RepID=UPI003D04235C